MRVLWILFASLILLVGCNTGEIGTACSGGATEAGLCVEGAVCASDADPGEAPPDPPNAIPSFCRAICDTSFDCTEPGFECREVVGSMVRACQPEDDDTTPIPAADGGT
jgi:hypothetical protein